MSKFLLLALAALLCGACTAVEEAGTDVTEKFEQGITGQGRLISPDPTADSSGLLVDVRGRIGRRSDLRATLREVRLPWVDQRFGLGLDLRGVASGRDAYAKIRAGASLVQLYSALALQGPALLPQLKAELAALIRADGFHSVAEAVGADHA